MNRCLVVAVGALWAAGLALPMAAAEGGAGAGLRVGVIGLDLPDTFGWVEPILTGALRDGGATVVERDAVLAVLDEQALHAAAGGEGLELGRLQAADALLLIRARRGRDEEPLLHAAVVEVRTSVVAAERCWVAPQPDDLAEGRVGGWLRHALTKAAVPDERRRYVAIATLVAEEPDERLGSLAGGVELLLSEALMQLPEVCLVERDRLAKLGFERDAAGQELGLHGAALLIDGSVGWAGPEVVRLTLRQARPGAAADTARVVHVERPWPQRHLLPADAAGLIVGAAPEPAAPAAGPDPAAEAAQLLSHARWLVGSRRFAAGYRFVMGSALLSDAVESLDAGQAVLGRIAAQVNLHDSPLLRGDLSVAELFQVAIDRAGFRRRVDAARFDAGALHQVGVTAEEAAKGFADATRADAELQPWLHRLRAAELGRLDALAAALDPSSTAHRRAVLEHGRFDATTQLDPAAATAAARDLHRLAVSHPAELPDGRVVWDEVRSWRALAHATGIDAWLRAQPEPALWTSGYCIVLDTAPRAAQTPELAVELLDRLLRSPDAIITTNSDFTGVLLAGEIITRRRQEGALAARVRDFLDTAAAAGDYAALLRRPFILAAVIERTGDAHRAALWERVEVMLSRAPDEVRADQQAVALLEQRGRYEQGRAAPAPSADPWRGLRLREAEAADAPPPPWRPHQFIADERTGGVVDAVLVLWTLPTPVRFAGELVGVRITRYDPARGAHTLVAEGVGPPLMGSVEMATAGGAVFLLDRLGRLRFTADGKVHTIEDGRDYTRALAQCMMRPVGRELVVVLDSRVYRFDRQARALMLLGAADSADPDRNFGGGGQFRTLGATGVGDRLFAMAVQRGSVSPASNPAEAWTLDFATGQWRRQWSRASCEVYAAHGRFAVRDWATRDADELLPDGAWRRMPPEEYHGLPRFERRTIRGPTGIVSCNAGTISPPPPRAAVGAEGVALEAWPADPVVPLGDRWLLVCRGDAGRPIRFLVIAPLP